MPINSEELQFISKNYFNNQHIELQEALTRQDIVDVLDVLNIQIAQLSAQEKLGCLLVLASAHSDNITNDILTEASKKLDISDELFYVTMLASGVESFFKNITKNIAESSHIKRCLDNALFLDALLTPWRNIQGIDNNKSALFLLVTTSNGRAILANWTKDTQFTQELLQHADLVPTLLTLQPDTARDQANTSAFFWLVTNSDGRAIFIDWMQNTKFRENLLQHEDLLPALLALQPDATRDRANTSAFFWLFTNQDGRAIFADWMKNVEFKAKLLQHADLLPALLALRPDAAQDDAKLSALCLLIVNRYSQTILLDWMQNAEFRKNLLQHADLVPTLLARRPTGINTNLSILFLFTATIEGRAILIDWMKNPEFTHNLLRDDKSFFDALLKLQSKQAKIKANTSAFFWLVSTDNGKKIFNNWMQNPKFRENLLKHEDLLPALLALQSDAISGGFNTSTLFWLVTANDGREIFINLMQDATFKENLFQHKLFFPALLTLRPAGVNANLSTLFVLTENAQGQTILADWMKNVEFREKLLRNESFFTTLFALRPTGDDANLSVVSWLASTNDGQTILADWMENVEFREKLLQHADLLPALLALRPDTATINANTSGLFWLVVTDNGKQILNNWMENVEFREKLLQHADLLPALLALRPDTTGVSANTSGLFWLVSADDGRAMLAAWMENVEFREKLLQHADLLPALLALRPATAKIDANTSALFWLVAIDDGKKILSDWMDNAQFIQNLLQHELFLTALLTLQPATAKIDANTSALFWLVTTDGGRAMLAAWMENVEFREKLLQRADLLPALLTRQLTETNTNLSTLFFLTEHTKGRTILANWMENAEFTQNLLRDESFFTALFALQPDTAGSKANTSAFFWLITAQDGRVIFDNWMDNIEFIQNLLQHEPFFRALLTLRPDTVEVEVEGDANTSALFWLVAANDGRAMFIHFMQDVGFSEALLQHELFFPTLLALRPDSARISTNFSCFFYLAEALPQPIVHASLISIFNDQHFSNWIQVPQHQQDLITTLLATTRSSSTCIFSILLSKGQNIVKLLMSQPIIKAAFFNHFSISEFTSELITQLLKTDAGFFLFYALFQTGRISLLQQHHTLQSLFNNSQIQQLIQMNIIKPEWFLFVAANQFDNADFIFFLNQKTISPSAVNSRGYSLYEVINELSIDDDNKKERQTQLQRALTQESSQNSENNIWMHLNQFTQLKITTQTSSLQLPPLRELTQNNWLLLKSTNARNEINIDVLSPLMKNHDGWIMYNNELYHWVQKFQELSLLSLNTEEFNKLNSIINSLEENQLRVASDEEVNLITLVTGKQLPKETIDNVDDALIQQFNQYIKWVFIQPQLEAYHDAFRNLSDNPSFRNTLNFPLVLDALSRLIPAMNHQLNLNKIPPFDDHAQKLSLCFIAVLECLNQMTVIFTGEHPFRSYLKNVENTAISNYNRLFMVASNMEVHIPKQSIESSIGLPYHQALLPYDPFRLHWSQIQITWVAQTIAESLINTDAGFEDAMVKPLLDSIMVALSSDNGYITEILVNDLKPEHPLMMAKEELFDNSPLFQNKFDVYQFLGFIFNLTQLQLDQLSESDDKIQSIDHAFIQTNLERNLKNNLSNWLDQPEQRAIPRHHIIDSFNELLWKFLTQEDVNQLNIRQLLEKIPEAIDAPALIKDCLESHQDEIHLLKPERLFQSLSNSKHTTLFSVLLANPLYAGWLWGFEINITKTRSNQIILQFNEHYNASPIENKLKQDEWKEWVKNELEYILIQPGTLFFWLYYCKQISLHHELFNVVIGFLLSKSNHLFIYDSFLPILYNMQISPSTSENDKVLVRSFLEAHMSQQLSNQNGAYWQTACYLVDTPEAMKERTQQDCLKHSWLNHKTQNQQSSDAVNYLLNRDEDPSQLTVTSVSMFQPRAQPSSTSVNPCLSSSK